MTRLSWAVRISRTSATLAVAISIAVFGILSFQISKKKSALEDLQSTLKKKQAEVKGLQSTLKKKQAEVEALQSTLKKDRADLRAVKSTIADFVFSVFEEAQLMPESVSSSKVKDHIIEMGRGKRQKAVIFSLMYAWKAIPFKLGGDDFQTGLDSTTFLYKVLNGAGVRIERDDGERLSSAMMSKFDRTKDPKSGDLVFYKGDIGNFGLMIVRPEAQDHEALAVGVLETGVPLQVLKLKNINADAYPKIGVFRVTYPDEQHQHN